MPSSYDQVELGEGIGAIEKMATDQAVREFCDVWGNPGDNRFTNDEVAKSMGLAAAIVPGVMSMAYMAQLLAHWSEGGLVKRLEVVFRQVVFHNQPLRIAGVVTDKNRVDDENQVECDVYVENAEGERLVGGKATVVMPA